MAGVVTVGYWPNLLIASLEKLTPRVLWRAHTTENVLALTFDDGPDSRYTPELLSILATHETRATFFLVGERARRFPEIVAAIRDAGHEIANHTDATARTIGVIGVEFEQSLLRAEETLGLAGTAPKFFRPAGGFIRPAQMDIAVRRGYTVTLGSGYALDPYRPPVDYMVWQMSRSLAAGAILVMHDAGGDRSGTLRAVERVIPLAKGRCFRFVTLTELVNLAANRTPN